MNREVPVQASFDEPTWPCPICQGTGRDRDCDSKRCFMCQGAQIVLLDPLDYSEVPF